MPPKKSSIGRGTRKAIQTSSYRNKESSSERRNRLEQMRNRAALSLELESEKHRDLRLEDLRTMANKRLLRESSIDRELRLSDLRQRDLKRKELETSEERNLRIEKARKNLALRIERETSADRVLRLSNARERSASQLANETQEERGVRIYNLRTRAAKIIAEESDHERDLRLHKKGRLNADVLAKENEAQRKQRIENNQQAKRHRIEKLTRLMQDVSKYSNLEEHDVIEYYLGEMNDQCEYCGSLNFAAEHTKDKSNVRGFSQCCGKGKVMLTSLLPYPDTLKQLLKGHHPESKCFRDNIRSINSSFAFASMGADLSLPAGIGPYCFRIQGQIYHRTGTLHPEENEKRKFAQLYILDDETAIAERLSLAGNSNVSSNLMKVVHGIMTSINLLGKSYKMMYEVEQECILAAEANGLEVPEISMAIKHDRNLDNRRYNATKANEVAVIFENADGEPPFNRDLIIHLRQGLDEYKTKPISILNENLDPMVYPLLFPTGEQGWGPTLKCSNGSRVTQMKYYQYRLAVRNNFNQLHHAGRLSQQYWVDSYVRMEANRLNYIKQNQPKLKVENYDALMDHIAANSNANEFGNPVILPSSFEGSPRNMHQRYQDAMAIVTKYGRPDLFITVTCNPKWKEIEDNLDGEDAQDRPDIVVRVFDLKLKKILEEIKSGLFGQIAAMVYVIEFQKRGLPHAHILVILSQDFKLKTEEDIDEYISAELPDPDKYPRLFEAVSKHMIHGPCGILNPKRVCMENDKCQKQFPKDLCEFTRKEVNGYPLYRRRKTEAVTVRNKPVDNSWVVPYNPYLLLKFNCHINVESCASVKAVKYLFKYVYKGHDCANLEIKNYNETVKFVDSRYVSPPEAAWRIRGNLMHWQSHHIERLAVHLSGKHWIFYEENQLQDNPEFVAERANRRTSTLLAWFELNKTDSNAHKYYYREIPEYYTFNGFNWSLRVKGGNRTIGRMYTVNPRDEERYFLRLLLLHVKAATSFEFLRTYQDVLYKTFRDAAKARGLLLDESIWRETMSDAVLFSMPSQLRNLFAYICVFGPPGQCKKELWDEFKKEMVEDYCHFLHNSNGDCTNCEYYALKDIQDVLVCHGFQCSNFGIQNPPSNLPSFEGFLDLDEQKRLGVEMLENVMKVESQRIAYEKIIASVKGTSPIRNTFFVDGPGGSGKTYLYKTLIATLRGQGLHVLSSATTGIASNLLPDGRTMHSLFGLPVPLNETSASRLSSKTQAGEEMKKANLLILDECTMAPHHALNAIEKMLRDVMENSKPFGGKTIVLGGDFRQCLSVMKNAKQAAIVQGSIKSSPDWGRFETLKLTSNMRSVDNFYSNWLIKLGDGTLESSLGNDLVEIPDDMLCETDLASFVFGDILSPSDMEKYTGRAILCPKNSSVDVMNYKVLEKLDGQVVTYYSEDGIETDNEQDRNNYPTEFLNSLNPSGMPPHCLMLKVGAIIILLRNLNTRKGLCNGTRVIVTSLSHHVIEAKIINGSGSGEVCLIPRIELCPSETGLPFKLKRRQFPVKLAFAMTINKSRGQTLERVGLYLPEPVFGHGQLYVACSRVRRRSDIKILIEEGPLQGKLIKNSDQVFTKNVVYREIF